MSKILLICNGEKPGKWLKKYAVQADFILAADGGAEGTLCAAIKPDAVIGDLDSVSARIRRMLKNIPFIHVKRQDNTDLEKALDWISAQRFDECIIAGVTGGRLDFTLGNVLSARPYLTKLNIRFVGSNWTLLPLIKGHTFSAKKGARCSFIPLTDCKNVTLKGVKYRVVKEQWDTQHIGRSLSNKITAAKSEITFDSGFMLLYCENYISAEN